ncbi:SMP-30/gluconolactonase/LRE family protein (plasmid) [Peteryoungia desertarenae]|uniref:SMP-30/gluconolactonase/LRE family protein n=1 Tax=Peteryoungia desertarenae TaxID=1813451 RepID=A0ABX6QSM1_9HYPH|nr:SMP-30/gluconolactonase/LRE family protein [Peteryoungia desertarenae]QLF71553.1 SMP-30/gluconolactonase/LRE family protein [Peteryoungia desertarenae]
MTFSFEILSDTWGHLGESPVLSKDGHYLWWVDTEGWRLLRSHTGTGATETWQTPEIIGCIALRDDGTLLAGLASGLFIFNPQTGLFQQACSPETRNDMRFNDCALDPVGRFWAGTMHRDITEPAGALFCVERDLTHKRFFDGLWTPNGLAFDADRARMYFSDSHPSIQTIWVCDYDLASGNPSNKRVFARTEHVEGRPDGAFVDDSGVYWIAGVGGSQILRFAPTGDMLEPIPVPVTHPTKLVHQGDGLLITTRRTAPANVSDMSGHVLRARRTD